METTTTTVPVTATSLGYDVEERRSEVEFALGFIHAIYSLDPNDEQLACLTGDDVLAVSPEQVDVAELATIVTLMCMPDELLAAQTELHAVAHPDATERQLAALDCTFRNGVAEFEGLDLNERLALEDDSEATQEKLDDLKVACDLSDDDVNFLEQL